MGKIIEFSKDAEITVYSTEEGRAQAAARRILRRFSVVLAGCSGVHDL